MNIAIPDLLLVVLLSLFFGLQQRRRQELYYRSWFAGFVLLLGSLTVWEIMRQLTWHGRVLDALRFDLLVLSGMAFAMSFLLTPERVKKTLALGFAIAVPACAAFDLQTMPLLPPRATQAVVLLLMVAGQGLAVAAVQLGLPRAWKVRRAALTTLYAGVGAWTVVHVASYPGWTFDSYVLCEIFLSAAVFYASIWGGRSLAGSVGAVGFAAWAVFYPVSDALIAYPHALHVLFQFWELPKYFVGFSMILRVSEDSAEELAHRARHDELTGLPTRAMLYERLDEGTAMGRQQQNRLALLAVDIDHFKRVNDNHGHITGDECLKAVAERLRQERPHVEMVARTGGEEFMAVVSGIAGEADARRVAQELLDAFQEPVRVPDCALALTISIGIALFPDHGEDSETLRRMADAALYQAKRDGRNCMRMAQVA